ncbi:hypothetical protein M378DRAFT_466342 [Amanita muscaria Koide BX008]|uniref:Uncharacterized protein n=1 Tax=Amanita muscaria (strain Koide BX008) TaxID=946122 RepID=A0A0C2WK60_AMAMK|nr:hypothetical protein M378DRAFT_466342 [Amanita muscaria Koide BX008]
MNSNQTTLLLPLGQQQPQSTHSEFWAAPQHPQWSHFQAPPSLELEYNPWMVPLAGDGSSRDCEQSAFDTNYDYGSQWLGQQHQFQQPQYHLPPPVAQPFSQPVEPNYDPYQPTAGYAWQQPVASPQPPLYHPRPQPQYQHQQQRLYRTPSPQDIMPAKRQRFDDPNLNGQAYWHHAPLPPQPHIEPLPLPAQTAGVYHGQGQGSGYGDGDRWLNNLQPSANTEGRGARGESMSSEIADGNPGGGGRRGGQSGGDVHAHWFGGNFGGAASIQAEARNTVPTSAEPAATLLHGAHGFSINGNPWFADIGTNMGHLTTVNNYGGTHGVSLSVLHRLIHLTELNFKA